MVAPLIMATITSVLLKKKPVILQIYGAGIIVRQIANVTPAKGTVIPTLTAPLATAITTWEQTTARFPQWMFVKKKK
jgi:hypothetical protein